MKKILVPLEIHQDNPIIGIHGARPTYIKKLVKYNLEPIFVSPLETNKMINEKYNLCAGAYFIGGEDWDPALYKEKKHPKTEPLEKIRDKIELPLLKRILKDRKPFLGLCRGGQGLVIATGGTLIQHVPDFYLQENHNPNACYDDLLISQKHPIRINKNSKFYRIIKKEKIMVNSYHHQAAKTLGKMLRVAAESPAGVIEVIEHKDPNYFCFGIESHPEAEENSFFENLFIAFARAVKSANNSLNS